MNTLLTKHIETEPGKTHDESVKEYVKAWNASKYLLRPLKKLLQERLQTNDTIKETDFDIANHYAKLMFQNGKKAEDKLLLDLLPKTLED